MTGQNGVSELDVLLRTMDPERRPGTVVYVTGVEVPPEQVLATVREAEGLSCVVDRDLADAHGWAYGPPLAWISLRVHSDLEAVGLTAAVAEALADDGIACNVLAGLFHDHLLVPEPDAGRAMAALQRLSEQDTSDRRREIQREGLTMALYISISLLAVMAALPAPQTQSRVTLALTLLLASVGLVLAHQIAFRLSSRLVQPGSTLDPAGVRLLTAQLIGGAAVTAIAVVPVLLFGAAAYREIGRAHV